MRLIADAGSTKSTWIAILADGSRRTYDTSPINALLMDDACIRRILADELQPLVASAEAVDKIWYYGAGCIPGKPSDDMRLRLTEATGCRDVEVATDMLLAARSLCGHKPGIACILGTGSNSCLYDGEAIIDNVPPLGYILGDEGSGAVLGRTLVSDVFKRRMPHHVADAFLKYCGLTYNEIISRIYREPAPNRFLASLVPFIAENIGIPEIEAMTIGAFRSFLQRNVGNYEGCRCLPVNFAGSVAWAFADQLGCACRAEGFHLGKIMRRPADNIADYHIAT